jgi:hypothetical protein
MSAPAERAVQFFSGESCWSLPSLIFIYRRKLSLIGSLLTLGLVYGHNCYGGGTGIQSMGMYWMIFELACNMCAWLWVVAPDIRRCSGAQWWLRPWKKVQCMTATLAQGEWVGKVAPTLGKRGWNSVLFFGEGIVVASLGVIVLASSLCEEQCHEFWVAPSAEFSVR